MSINLSKYKVKRSNKSPQAKIVSNSSELAREEDRKEIENELNKQTNSDSDKVSSIRSSRHITSTMLTKQLKLDDMGLDHEYFDTFSPINIGNTLYPLNTPCYFCGQKGSGKTYLLASIAQYAYKLKLISRIIYIYADNIDTTISRALPKKAFMSVPKIIASKFLYKFLRKKTKFTSCTNFLQSIKKIPKTLLGKKLSDVNTYDDPLLTTISNTKHLSTVGEMIRYCEHVLAKYLKGTQLNFGNDFKFNIGKFTTNDFDFIILDDIAQFMDLFGTTRNNSGLYPYFTITRQNKTTFYMTGQEVKQLPKMFREMLGAIVLLNGTNMGDLDNIKLDHETLDIFKHEFVKLSNHEGILYNFNDREYEIIKK